MQKQQVWALTMAAMAVVISWSLYARHHRAEVERERRLTAKEKDVALSGKVVCLACELAAEGAIEPEAKQCQQSGHLWVLRGADGKVYHFLRSKPADALVKGERYHGATVEIKGTVFASGNAVSLTSFRETQEPETTHHSPLRQDVFSAPTFTTHQPVVTIKGRLGCPG